MQLKNIVGHAWIQLLFLEGFTVDNVILCHKNIKDYTRNNVSPVCMIKVATWSTKAL